MFPIVRRRLQIRRFHWFLLGIVVALAMPGSTVCAQPAPPLQMPVEVPESDDAPLVRFTLHPDRAIVDRFIRENGAKLDGLPGFTPQYDRREIYVGRHQMAPGAEAQILVLLTKEVYCWKFGCPGFALSKENGKWKLETTLRGYRSEALAFVLFAKKPIPARLYNPGTDEFDIAAVIAPTNQGRRTFFWQESGYFWNGKEWDLFCWWHFCK